jgi:uncharacterized protein (TIGR02145 family)
MSFDNRNKNRIKSIKMRELYIFATLSVIFGFAACTVKNVSTPQSSQSEQGVVINGVRWATRNVETPGIFTATSESSGRLYQWNRLQSWGTVGEIEGWDSSVPPNQWDADNDPCPQGWRMPTQAELSALENSGTAAITRNGAVGRLYGTAPNQIFLPAAGWRNNAGALNSTGVDGYYWSSTPIGGENVGTLWLSSEYSDVGHNFAAYGFSIRCVAK